MNNLDFILGNDYEMILNSISSNSFDNIIQFINDEFEKHYQGSYKKVKGTPLEGVMKRIKHYVFTKKRYCLKNYIGEEQLNYINEMSCFLCLLNHPCERCNAFTPFDIFKIDKAENRFLYSCRKTRNGKCKHICLLCFSNVGNPKHIRRPRGVKKLN
jgi:hypothetical protein